VCDIAGQAEKAFQSQDWETLLAMVGGIDSMCPNGRPYALCQGSTGGNPRLGIPIVRLGSEGSVLSPRQLSDFLKLTLESARPDLSDQYGGGGLKLASIGCPPPGEGEVLSCTNAFTLVFTAIEMRPDFAQPTRLVVGLVFQCNPDACSHHLYEVASGSLQGATGAAVEGGIVDSRRSAGLCVLVGDWSSPCSDLGTFFPWTR
jgi:hypothetical protein